MIDARSRMTPAYQCGEIRLPIIAGFASVGADIPAWWPKTVLSCDDEIGTIDFQRQGNAESRLSNHEYTTDA